MPPKAGGGKGGAGASAGSKPSSRRAGGGGGGVGGADFLKSEEVLQAVLLADSFQVKFRPLTLQKPKVLLPLLNIPLLEYALEFLVSGGVCELFVFCCSHAGAVQAYLDDPHTGGKWRRRKGVRVQVIVSSGCYSFGDAMRHVERLDIVKGDFVLMSGDVVSNVKLQEVLKQHKARVALDKRNLMTLLFKPASHAHRTRPLGDDAVLALDPTTSQLLLYDNDPLSRRVLLHTELLSSLKQPLQLRYDLLDAHISVCTPEVLMLFADNFDWQTFQEDFVRGVLSSEIHGHKLFVHLLQQGEYAARCSDLRTYDAVSRDVLHRWAYPLVPDSNLLCAVSGPTTFRCLRGNCYREEGVQVSREAKIGAETVIGAGTRVGARSSVKRTVIGRECAIGAGVSLHGSHVWDGVTIEDGAVVDRALLADGVVVGAGARIGRGAILGYNVVIGAGHVVPPYTRITTAAQDDEDEENARADGGDESAAAATAAPARAAAAPVAAAPAQAWNPKEVGPGGVGRVYVVASDEDGEDDGGDDGADSDARRRFPYAQSELNSIAPNPAAIAAWLARVQYAADDGADDDFDFSEAEVSPDDDNAADDEEGGALDPARANQVGRHARLTNLPFHKFASEAAETLKRGADEGLPLDDISLEMSGLKFSHNVTVEEFAHATFLALFAIVADSVAKQAAAAGTPKHAAAAASLDPSQNKAAMQSLGTQLKTWHPILAKFANLHADQVHMLLGLEQACLASGFVSSSGGQAASPAHASGGAAAGALQPSPYTPLFTPTLQLMYNNFNVFAEEAIVEWATMAEEAEGESHPLLVQSKKFREWLAEAESESEEEGEEED